MLQALCGVDAVGMLMAADRTVAGNGLRVLLATTQEDDVHDFDVMIASRYLEALR